MRAIKFRAFYMGKIRNVMNIEFWNDGYPYGLVVSDDDGFPHTIEPYHEPEVPLMQFIGLKDKNGKEIYEGDIITFQKDDSDLWGTRHDKEQYREVVGEMRPPLNSEEIMGGPDGIVKMIEIEVIGNIYENPDVCQIKEGL